MHANHGIFTSHEGPYMVIDKDNFLHGCGVVCSFVVIKYDIWDTGAYDPKTSVTRGFQANNRLIYTLTA